jgi:hypothetical protein
MEEFIERYYNVCRLHSALGYRRPKTSKKSAYENPRERRTRGVNPSSETI